MRNKIEEAIKKFNLNLDRDERYELYRNLMKINEKVVEKISKKFKSKRLIFFIIKKLLDGKDKITLNLSRETMKFYNK